jgi:hypothetical protein
MMAPTYIRKEKNRQEKINHAGIFSVIGGRRAGVALSEPLHGGFPGGRITGPGGSGKGVMGSRS